MVEIVLELAFLYEHLPHYIYTVAPKALLPWNILLRTFGKKALLINARVLNFLSPMRAHMNMARFPLSWCWFHMYHLLCYSYRQWREEHSKPEVTVWVSVVSPKVFADGKWLIFRTADERMPGGYQEIRNHYKYLACRLTSLMEPGVHWCLLWLLLCCCYKGSTDILLPQKLGSACIPCPSIFHYFVFSCSLGRKAES